MRTVSSLQGLRRVRCPVVLVAGFFDGVHRGHRKIIRAAQVRAEQLGGQAWVLTFDRHPASLLAPDRAPPMLTTNRYRLLQLERLGVAGCVVLPFTRPFAARRAEEFFAELAACLPRDSELRVGENWRFGRGGEGDSALLERLSAEHGVRAMSMRTKCSGGRAISSTRIRRAVASGRLDAAARLLGREFATLGRVVRGRGVGATLGFPTANIDTGEAMLPPRGVYAVCALIRGAAHRGVANVGVCPTFAGADGRRDSLEVHVFGRQPRLYGEWVEVLFVKKIRGERAFGSVDALRRRMEKDVAEAARLLARKKVSKNTFTGCAETDI